MFVVAVFVFVSMARDILVGDYDGWKFCPRERRIVLCLIG